jgi:hypothetical protein
LKRKGPVVSTESLVISSGTLTIDAASTMINLTFNSRTQLSNPHE